MSEITGLPLRGPMRATIQRMEPGQYAEPHTDRPLLGYEAARLIVQLNTDWEPAHGGELHLHPDANGHESTLIRPPTFNSAFGFVMGASSFHSVQPARRRRRTAVFNFWHSGNSPEFASWVRGQREGIRFEALPRALDATRAVAELGYAEDDSFRAGVVAFLLQKWGFEDTFVCDAYSAAVRSVEFSRSEALPLLMARWVHALGYHEAFCVGQWSELRDLAQASPWSRDERLAEILRLGFDFRRRSSSRVHYRVQL